MVHRFFCIPTIPFWRTGSWWTFYRLWAIPHHSQVFFRSSAGLPRAPPGFPKSCHSGPRNFSLLALVSPLPDLEENWAPFPAALPVAGDHSVCLHLAVVSPLLSYSRHPVAISEGSPPVTEGGCDWGQVPSKAGHHRTPWLLLRGSFLLWCRLQIRSAWSQVPSETSSIVCTLAVREDVSQHRWSHLSGGAGVYVLYVIGLSQTVIEGLQTGTWLA